MGVEFKLSDRELPVSPGFITCLAQWLRGERFAGERWPDQLAETLAADPALRQRASEAAAAVMRSVAGREILGRCYTLLFALLTGDLAPVRDLHSRFHFVTVIGIPRTGGSYLTAELYRALGLPPEQVPDVLAHDSFPEAAPFELLPGANSWTLTLKTTAEYLTLVELFFGHRPAHEGRIVVPKKLTKAAYAGGLFRRVLGEGAEHVLSVRHPAAACVSTYEKSGGLPPDGRFAVRSNIEGWCRRDLQHAGCGAQLLQSLEYFDAYLRYWELYHLALATSGLAESGDVRVVAYGQAALQGLAQSYHDRFGSGLRARPFEVSDKARRRHPQWFEQAKPVVERVAAVWGGVGLAFPADEVLSGS